MLHCSVVVICCGYKNEVIPVAIPEGDSIMRSGGNHYVKISHSPIYPKMLVGYSGVKYNELIKTVEVLK